MNLASTKPIHNKALLLGALLIPGTTRAFTGGKIDLFLSLGLMIVLAGIFLKDHFSQLDERMKPAANMVMFFGFTFGISAYTVISNILDGSLTKSISVVMGSLSSGQPSGLPVEEAAATNLFFGVCLSMLVVNLNLRYFIEKGGKSAEAT